MPEFSAGRVFMRTITDERDYDNIWKKLVKEYRFRPGAKPPEQWLTVPGKSKPYCLNGHGCWNGEQEKTVNAIFERICPGTMCALDWQHDCFFYDPRERIPLHYGYYDAMRKCNVYFPCYYPDGDHYFFVTPDWRAGLFGHPWRKEIIVMGEKLIAEFEKVKDILELTEKRGVF